MMYTALIADDEPIIVRGLKKLLPWEQLNVAFVGEAFNGDQASQLLFSLQPDILISDICMPGKTGITLLHEVANSGLGAKVIFLSGHQEFAYVKEAIAYGALDYILKPIGKEQLAQTVRKAIALIDKERTDAELRRKLLSYESKRGITPGDEFPAASIGQTDIHKVKEFVEKNFDQNITLETVAGIACMNPYYFSAFFKKQTGENFKDFLLRVRMEKALSLLLHSDCKTYEIAEKVGFNDPKHFSQVFKKFYGEHPMEYKKNQS